MKMNVISPEQGRGFGEPLPAFRRVIEDQNTKYMPPSSERYSTMFPASYIAQMQPEEMPRS